MTLTASEQRPTLGRLTRVDLRSFWRDESKDFTPWLAREENVTLLGEAIEVDLEIEGIEVSVGRYFADIVARDVGGDRRVIVENQLEKTDHDHLGKIITYAAGLGAEIVIWICQNVSEEHREAVDWLNENSGEEIAFFALEVELWQIEGSPPAPKFNVVCRPNEWTKSIRGAASSKDLSETKALQLDFWTKLKDHMEQKGTILRLRKPRAQHWYTAAIGRSKFNISMTVNTQANRLGCEVYIRGSQAKKAFALLHAQIDQIESDFGSALDWQELPEGKDCRIIAYRDGDIREEDEWPDYHQWFQHSAERLYGAFSDRIKALEL